MASEALVPRFMPPLFSLYAAREALKAKEKEEQPSGDRERPAHYGLTQSECEEIRDAATVMMVTAANFERHSSGQMFQDVDPRNCFADWHGRVRPQAVRDVFPLPKIVLCALFATAADAEKAEAVLRAEQTDQLASIESFERQDLETASERQRMLRAFVVSAMPEQFTSEEQASIQACKAVIYFLSENFAPPTAIATSERMLRVASRLFAETNCVGLKCESSGTALTRSKWLQLFASLAPLPSTMSDDEHHALDGSNESSKDRKQQQPQGSDGGLKCLTLYHAFVKQAIGDMVAGGQVHTCGMHLLGRPDAVVDLQVGSPEEVETLVVVLTAFNVYTLDECPNFRAGETFRAFADGERFRASWEPCGAGYEEDDFFFNPYGWWRLTRVA